MGDDPRRFLTVQLASAVGEAIPRVAEWPVSRRIKEAESLADLIGAGGDMILAERPVRGCAHPDQIREAVATGLAILAHRPGGATFAGLHWCVNEHLACPGAGAWGLPEQALTQSARGAVFTPRDLAERVAAATLRPITSGLASAEILTLRVCDPAVGSGSLLVAACRHLASQVAAAWLAEAGCPVVAEPAMTQAARRLVQRCLYGVDIDPLSVELARLALALLAPAQPDVLAARIVVGDSLVGCTNVPQLNDLDPQCFPPSVAPLHWPLAFPEVYVGAGREPGFDAVVSNPPFLGGQKITGALGKPYRDYLVRVVAGGVRGSADLAAYFLLRCHDIAATHARIGVIATNTLAQGDTRTVGLSRLVDHGWTITGAVKSEQWPNRSAALQYSIVWTQGGDRVRPFGGWPTHEPIPGPAGIEHDYETALLYALAREAA